MLQLSGSESDGGAGDSGGGDADTEDEEPGGDEEHLADLMAAATTIK